MVPGGIQTEVWEASRSRGSDALSASPESYTQEETRHIYTNPKPIMRAHTVVKL